LILVFLLIIVDTSFTRVPPLAGMFRNPSTQAIIRRIFTIRQSGFVSQNQQATKQGASSYVFFSGRKLCW
jgi:hypothetical protein